MWYFLRDCFKIAAIMKFTKKEIVYLDPLHTAKTLVLVYLCFSVPIVLLALFVAFVRDGSIPGFTVVSALILNALLGFGLLWIACKVYNWVADKFGGIELALRELPDEIETD
jgi:hypothetical protein